MGGVQPFEAVMSRPAGVRSSVVPGYDGAVSAGAALKAQNRRMRHCSRSDRVHLDRRPVTKSFTIGSWRSVYRTIS